MKFRRQPLARGGAICLAAISLAVTVLVGRIGLACHLPFAPDPQNLAQLAQLTKSSQSSWRAVHILAAGCRCSSRVAEHLASRGTLPGLHESAVLIGSDEGIAAQIRSSGLPLTVITPAEASGRYQIDGAPMFVLVTPEGRLRYAGGYATDRNARDGYLDVVIWKAISAGTAFHALPVFGCAVSHRAKKAIDPLGLGSFTLGTEND